MHLNDQTQTFISPVRPGEQWFFYWKTSAALWEKYIVDSPIEETIYIPLNWGAHAEANGVWDFGQIFAERDLGRLIDLLTRHNRRSCWLLPIGPSPFLANGGVPIAAARSLSSSAFGMNYACLDQEGTLYKIYSYFDPKVFQFYSGFVFELAKLFVSKNLKTSVWGVEYFFHENETYTSFFSDYSLSFEQGFSRFIKKSFPDGLEINSALEEQELKKKFTEEVSQLFLTVASEALSIFWKGKKEINVLGAGPKDTILRSLSEGHSQVFLFQELFTSHIHQKWISTALLNPNEKKSLLTSCLVEHFGSTELQIQYEARTVHSDSESDFRSFALVDVFDFYEPLIFEYNGLKDYLRKNCRWMYYIHDQIDFTPQWIDSSADRIKFFHAKKMNRLMLAKMLKLFMMGQKIVFDRDGISEDLDQRLQIFYLENNLKLQTVNFLSPVNVAPLGEGRLLTFEGKFLTRPEQQESFWKHIFKFMKMDHPLLASDDDVFNLWRIRSTSSQELNYIDVRRVNLYNPTSYKKNVKIQNQKRFAFLRMIDPQKASVKTSSEGVDIELLPHGKIALDFGHYEVTT
jgi:hypothetical protein